jgi:hypothetical protein
LYDDDDDDGDDDDYDEDDDDSPAVRLMLVNVALPRLIIADRQVNMPAAW